MAAALLAGQSALGSAGDPVLADRWLAEGGVEFAARTAVELSSMICTEADLPRAQFAPVTRPGRRGYRCRGNPLVLPTIARVRAVLAACDEDDHALVVEALVGMRTDDPHRRVATSFLVPTMTAWVDADCATVASARCDRLRQLLMTAASTAGHAAKLVHPGVPAWLLRLPGVVTALVEGVGSPVAPSLDA